LRSDLSNKPKSEAGLDLTCKLFCAVCGMTKEVLHVDPRTTYKNLTTRQPT